MTVRPGMSAARCSTCQAESVWVVTEKGAKMPVDAKPQRLFALEPNPAQPAPPLARSTLCFTSTLRELPRPG